MVTLLWKSGEGAGEPSDGRRWGVWVSQSNGAGAGGSLASRVGGLLDTAFKRRRGRKTSPPPVCGAGVLGPSGTIVRAYL